MKDVIDDGDFVLASPALGPGIHDISAEAVAVALTGKRGSGTFAYISPEDRHLAGKKWHLCTDGYARRHATISEIEAGSPVNIAMHREVLGLHLIKGKPGSGDVDHRNGVRLDNTRNNLRQVSRSDNNLNRHRTTGHSKFTGVSFFKPARLWRAYVNLNRKRIELGYFKSERKAALARNEYCRANIPTAKLNEV